MRKQSLLYILIIATFVLTACAGPTAAPAAQPTKAAAQPAATQPAAAAAPTTAPAATSKYSEAPMLVDLEKSGKLPPLEERLPADVFVVGPGTYLTKEQLPDWQPGVYGGTLRAAHAVANWAPDIFVAMNEPLLLAPKIGVQGIVGNVVKDYKVENNNQDFTFFMRKGLKWSDGQPVTSEDVRFTWEDIQSNDKLNPIFPAMFRNGYSGDGDPGKLTILDDYTFKIQFTKPYGGFLRNLTI